VCFLRASPTCSFILLSNININSRLFCKCVCLRIFYACIFLWTSVCFVRGDFFISPVLGHLVFEKHSFHTQNQQHTHDHTSKNKASATIIINDLLLELLVEEECMFCTCVLLSRRLNELTVNIYNGSSIVRSPTRTSFAPGCSDAGRSEAIWPERGLEQQTSRCSKTKKAYR